jgi:hypothetical protein
MQRVLAIDLKHSSWRLYLQTEVYVTNSEATCTDTAKVANEVYSLDRLCRN